jgi:catechol 2,3-dioxygenase-like lactoylglutathione lyase family enzyme
VVWRFHHAVIAVQVLDGAIGVFRDRLGLDARLGGRHAGRGTRNAIIRLERGYIELLAVPDPTAEIAAAGERGRVLVDYLTRREGGLVGYCLASDDIRADAERLRRNGLELVGPVPVERRRPDGETLRWQLIWPGGVNWRRPWPFIIASETPDLERTGADEPGHHELGAVGVAAISVAVRDLSAGRALYEQQLGLTPTGEEDIVPELAARRVRYRLGDVRIDLLAPSGPGPVAAGVEFDEGPFQLTLRVRSLPAAKTWLARSGIDLTPDPSRAEGWLIPPERALGARLGVVQAGSR